MIYSIDRLDNACSLLIVLLLSMIAMLPVLMHIKISIYYRNIIIKKRAIH